MKAESILFGWGQGTHDPSMPKNTNSPIDFHDNGFGVIAAVPSLGANPKYDSYVNVANPPKNIGMPKIIPLDPKLAGNRTSWPVGTKSNQPPATYTPGQISVAPGRPAPPGSENSPPLGQDPPPQALPPAAPIQTQPPDMAQNATVVSKPGAITITGDWEDDKDKKQAKATSPPPPPPPNACPPPQIPKPEDDLGVMPAVAGVPKKPPGGAGRPNRGPLNNIPPHRRQAQQPNSTVECLPQVSSPPPPMGLEPPKLPLPTSAGNPPDPPPIDDLGLNPKMSGVPNKPPGVGKIECGILYEVQGTLRYIC